jgi:hypothetical protein
MTADAFIYPEGVRPHRVEIALNDFGQVVLTPFVNVEVAKPPPYRSELKYEAGGINNGARGFYMAEPETKMTVEKRCASFILRTGNCAKVVTDALFDGRLDLADAAVVEAKLRTGQL